MRSLALCTALLLVSSPVGAWNLRQESNSNAQRLGRSAANATATHRRLDDFRFTVRMHWEEGVCWQEDCDTEFEWCLECEGSDCDEDDYLEIEECDRDDERQWFVREWIDQDERKIKLKPYTAQDLCWTRTRVRAHQLLPCGDGEYVDASGRDKQVLIGFDDNATFELHPNGRDEAIDCSECPMCMTNHHHPSKGETIKADDCESARDDNTSLWEVIWKEDINNGDDDDDDEDDLPELHNGGLHFCKENDCYECMGDCDDDDECVGDLLCYKRDRYEDVPGCSGGDENNNKLDFCYDPNWDERRRRRNKK